MTFIPPDDSAFIAAMERAKEKAELFHEQQQASIGAVTGAGSNFDHLRETVDPVTGERKRKGKASAKLSPLDVALMSASYQALYTDVSNALTDAQSKVYDALTKAADAVQDAKDALRDAKRDGASPDEIKAREKALEEARKRHDKLREYDRDLADIQRRMDDEDNPPSDEELDAFKRRIDNIERDIEKQPNNEPVSKAGFDHCQTGGMGESAKPVIKM